jgi:hypothetical protein
MAEQNDTVKIIVSSDQDNKFYELEFGYHEQQQ